MGGGVIVQKGLVILNKVGLGNTKPNRIRILFSRELSFNSDLQFNLFYKNYISFFFLLRKLYLVYEYKIHMCNVSDMYTVDHKIIQIKYTIYI